MSTINDKIWPPFEVFFIHSMLFNSQSGTCSIRKISAMLAHLPSKYTSEDLKRLPAHDILSELQNIVLQGAALSRYFWPVRKGYEARAKHLRESLEVKGDNPLRVRSLRNAIEHFDEKLDDYLSDGLVGVAYPEFVGPRPQSDVPFHLFRAYYLDCGIFQLLDHEYTIEPIAKEILRINKKLEFCLKHGGRLDVLGCNKKPSKDRQ